MASSPGQRAHHEGASLDPFQLLEVVAIFLQVSFGQRDPRPNTRIHKWSCSLFAQPKRRPLFNFWAGLLTKKMFEGPEASKPYVPPQVPRETLGSVVQWYRFFFQLFVGGCPTKMVQAQKGFPLFSQGH